MPLIVRARAHYEVVCDTCGQTAEVCGKRSIGMSGAADATRSFIASGWHHEVHVVAWHDETWIAEHGSGRWSYRACAPKPKRIRRSFPTI